MLLPETTTPPLSSFPNLVHIDLGTSALAHVCVQPLVDIGIEELHEGLGHLPCGLEGHGLLDELPP